MCHECDALAVELAELEVDALELEQDIRDGLAPAWARRPLFPHERAAGVRFADLDASIDRQARRVARLLEEHRSVVADAIAEQLRTATTSAELAQLVADLTNPARALGRDVPGLDQATRALERDLARALQEAHASGARSIAAEATAQGVPAAAAAELEAGGASAEQLAQRAATSAASPAREALRQLAAEAARANLYDLALPDAVARLEEAARTAGAKALETDAARTPVQQAHAQGRADATRAMPRARRYYASELLDRNTCGPCSLVDGVEYETLEAGEEDYPGGTYIGCEGGERCRGTLVAVWDTEADPTIADVAPVDRPDPPPPTDVDPDPGPPDPLPPAAPVVPEVDDLEELAAEAGVTVEEVQAARHELADLRRAMRAEASEVQLSARDWFTGGRSPLDGRRGPQTGMQVRTPAKSVKRTDEFGRSRYRREGEEGDYDWLEDLDPGELRRLQRRGWFDREGVTPDQVHQSLNAAAGDVAQDASTYSLDEAMRQWREHASLVDAAGAVARGKVPSLDHLVDLSQIAPDLAAEGWDLDLLLGATKGNDREALLHVLTKDAEDAAQLARRDLFGPFEDRTGRAYSAELGPAPWKMTADSYRVELLDLEHEIRTARDLGQPLPADAVARWHELVPVDDLDEFGAPLDAATLHGLIGELAAITKRGGWL